MGKGRGNWGHKGRPGKLGGSAPGSGGGGAVPPMHQISKHELQVKHADGTVSRGNSPIALANDIARRQSVLQGDPQKPELKAERGAMVAAARAAMREITRRPALQGFGGGPSENTIRMVAAERKFRAEELKKTRASVKDAYQKGVKARKLLKPVPVDKDGVPLRPEKPAGIISPRDLGGIKQFDAYVKGLRGEPRLKPKADYRSKMTKADNAKLEKMLDDIDKQGKSGGHRSPSNTRTVQHGWEIQSRRK